MSHAYGKARFNDGTILHFEYNGTCDLCCTALRKSADEVHDHWRADNCAVCSCGAPSEYCRLFAAYGSGSSWDGAACRQCMAITKGVDPCECDEDDGVPAWASDLIDINADVEIVHPSAGFLECHHDGVS